MFSRETFDAKCKTKMLRRSTNHLEFRTILASRVVARKVHLVGLLRRAKSYVDQNRAWLYYRSTDMDSIADWLAYVLVQPEISDADIAEGLSWTLEHTEWVKDRRIARVFLCAGAPAPATCDIWQWAAEWGFAGPEAGPLNYYWPATWSSAFLMRQFGSRLRDRVTTWSNWDHDPTLADLAAMELHRRRKPSLSNGISHAKTK